MAIVAALLVLKLFTLAGSLATTAAVVGLFAFQETLGPLFWPLLIGGFVAIAIGEAGAALIARSGRQE